MSEMQPRLHANESTDDFDPLMAENMDPEFINMTSGNSLTDPDNFQADDKEPTEVDRGTVLEDQLEVPFGVHITRRLGKLAKKGMISPVALSLSERGTVVDGKGDSGTFPDD